VTQLLRNALAPYFVLAVKKEDRMKATLTMVEFYREHLVPLLRAEDAHDLRKAHEVRSMVLNAEMKLQASLSRTESRGTHYREDYPYRNDPDGLVWILLRDVGGEMRASRVPVPRKWWPASDLSYEEKYPRRYPGEDVNLAG
jgi:succinate dehydrogenase/fumarate reductase flavoprotein subunit